MAPAGPFYTHYRARRHPFMALARRPVLARALRADVTTPALGVVLVWGEPLIGKTTLLRQVLWSLEPEKFVVARLPIGALAEPISGVCRASRILGEQAAVQFEADSGEAAAIRTSRTFPEALDRCMNAAEKADRTLVLALEGVDRYVGGAWPAGVPKHLALVLSRSPDLSVVLTSRLPLARLEAVEVPEQVRVHFVPPLEPPEARRLLTSPMRGRLEFQDEALEMLLGAAGGRPLLLQMIGRNCSRITEATGQTRVTVEIAQEVHTTCWLAGDWIFRPLVGNLLPQAQRVLAATALATSPAVPAPPFERIFQHVRLLGADLSLAAFANELNLLRLWRLLQSNDGQSFWVSCGWLGEFLRAGVTEVEEVAEV